MFVSFNQEIQFMNRFLVKVASKWAKYWIIFQSFWKSNFNLVKHDDTSWNLVKKFFENFCFEQHLVVVLESNLEAQFVVSSFPKFYYVPSCFNVFRDFNFNFFRNEPFFRLI
jgi:hypothetical protein